MTTQIQPDLAKLAFDIGVAGMRSAAQADAEFRRDLIRHTTDLEALGVEQAIADQLAKVDFTLTADDELYCAIAEGNRDLESAIKEAERETLKQRGFADPAYEVLVDVTAVKNCEETVKVGELTLQCGPFKESATVVMEVKEKRFVGGRNLWTFVARAKS